MGISMQELPNSHSCGEAPFNKDGLMLRYRTASGSDRIQALNEPVKAQLRRIEFMIGSLPLAAP